MCKFIFVVIILYGICNAIDSDSLYDENSGVVELTPENFNDLVIDDPNAAVWIVAFYAPWCLYSQALVPELKKAARALNYVVVFGAVNGDKYQDLAGKYGVPGFPFIKIFGRDKENPENYFGPRKAKQLIYAGWYAEFNNWFIES